MIVFGILKDFKGPMTYLVTVQVATIVGNVSQLLLMLKKGSEWT